MFVRRGLRRSFDAKSLRKLNIAERLAASNGCLAGGVSPGFPQQVAGSQVLGYTLAELTGCDVKAESLTQIISELSAEEQTAVREFIAFLKEQHSQQPSVTFQAALDEFINAHPDLLRRLAE